MRQLVLIFLVSFITISFYSCQQNCNCTKEQLDVFQSEMLQHYAMDVPKDSLICRYRDGLWLIKRSSFLDWQLGFDEEQLETEREFEIFKMPMRDASLVIPFIRHIRSKGFDIEYLEKEGREDSLITFQLFQDQTGIRIKQTYKFKGKHWKYEGELATPFTISNDRIDFSH
jgi:hypothetical protein